MNQFSPEQEEILRRLLEKVTSPQAMLGNDAYMKSHKKFDIRIPLELRKEMGQDADGVIYKNEEMTGHICELCGRKMLYQDESPGICIFCGRYICNHCGKACEGGCSRIVCIQCAGVYDGRYYCPGEFYKIRFKLRLHKLANLFRKKRNNNGQ